MKRDRIGLGLMILVWSVLHRLGRTWGSTREERDRNLPGDEIVDHPRLVMSHAVTVRASAQDVWPWLIQVGWHLAGWYTYRWVGRLLFPANPPSADEILPEEQQLQIGDRILDGAPPSRTASTWYSSSSRTR